MWGYFHSPQDLGVVVLYGTSTTAFLLILLRLVLPPEKAVVFLLSSLLPSYSQKDYLLTGGSLYRVLTNSYYSSFSMTVQLYLLVRIPLPMFEIQNGSIRLKTP